jgi:hypothetical protein
VRYCPECGREAVTVEVPEASAREWARIEAVASDITTRQAQVMRALVEQLQVMTVEDQLQLARVLRALSEFVCNGAA